MSCIYADRPYTGRIPTCEAGYFNCPNSPTCEEYTEYKPPTNADRIRAMSDEELAELLLDGCRGSNCDAQPQNEFGSVDCLKCRLNWLRQPADK